MKISKISEDIKLIVKNAANKMSSAERRKYIGWITIEYLDGNARKAESEFG